LSIPPGRRKPLFRSADTGDVDAVEQHRELGGIEARGNLRVADRRKAKTALLKALVVDDEAAVIPCENFRAVSSARDEDEKVAGEHVLSPAGPHERDQAVDAVPHVDRLRGEEDLHRAGEKKHPAYLSAPTSSAM
jgi:hypothetical protein